MWIIHFFLKEWRFRIILFSVFISKLLVHSSRIINLLSRRKLVYSFHGIHYDLNSWLIKKLYIYYENLFGKIDSFKIFVSKSEMKFAKKLSINVSENSLIIHNGVKNKIKKDYAKTIIRGITKSKIKNFNVISVCRLTNQKNVSEILHIAKLIPDVNFNILGDGELWKDLNAQLIKEKITNVFLKGNKVNVFNYLYESDIFLSTSLYEGLPISILEAMSIGLPVVASKVRGNTDTIEHAKSGYLYDLNNINMAAKFIKLLSKDPFLKKNISKQAFLRQRKIFNLDKMIKSYDDLYQNILKK